MTDGIKSMGAIMVLIFIGVFIAILVLCFAACQLTFGEYEIE